MSGKYRSENYLFTVENDDRGKALVEALRFNGIRIVVKGRHSNRREALGDQYMERTSLGHTFMNDVPVAKAQRLAIYRKPERN